MQTRTGIKLLPQYQDVEVVPRKRDYLVDQDDCKVPHSPLMVSLSNHAPYDKNVLRQAQDERIESILSTLQSSYLVNGERYQRVTTGLGITNKPLLTPWAKRMTLERVQETLLDPKVLEGLRVVVNNEPDGLAEDSLYRGWVDRLVADARKASDEYRDEAANRGASIHEEIQQAVDAGLDYRQGRWAGRWGRPSGSWPTPRLPWRPPRWWSGTTT